MQLQAIRFCRHTYSTKQIKDRRRYSLPAVGRHFFAALLSLPSSNASPCDENPEFCSIDTSEMAWTIGSSLSPRRRYLLERLVSNCLEKFPPVKQNRPRFLGQSPVDAELAVVLIPAASCFPTTPFPALDRIDLEHTYILGVWLSPSRSRQLSINWLVYFRLVPNGSRVPTTTRSWPVAV